MPSTTIPSPPSNKPPRIKATASKTLSVNDTRLPAVVALELAFRGRHVSDIRLTLWKEELRDLIRFAAKKFVGFQNVESLRKALDIVLGLVSVALAHETAGEENPARWAETVVAKTLLDLVKTAIALADQIHQDAAGKPFPYLLEIDRPVAGTKDQLVTYATARREGRWNGYERYVGDRDRARQTQAEDLLLRWLMVHLIGEAPGKISEKHPLLEDVVATSEVINALVFRHCTDLGVLNQAKKKVVILNRDDFTQVRKQFEKAGTAGKTWLAAAQKRHAALLEEIPAALRPGLGAHDWFETHLKKGPPKITDKTVMAENIPAITGIYYYDPFA